MENQPKQQKEGSGALFKNDRKQTENQPDYKGSITIAGMDYWISSWVKRSQNGTTYMSLQASPKEQANTQPTQQQPVNTQDNNQTQADDLPF